MPENVAITNAIRLKFKLEFRVDTSAITMKRTEKKNGLIKEIIIMRCRYFLFILVFSLLLMSFVFFLSFTNTHHF